MVELRPPEPDLLSAECYRFYGIIAGTTETRVVLTGVSSDRPLIQAYAFETSPPRGRGGEFRPVDTPGMTVHRSRMLEERTDASYCGLRSTTGVDAPLA